MAAMVKVDSRFKRLSLLVKWWAKRREINDASLGTMNSYAFCLLVLYFLQVTIAPRLSSSLPPSLPPSHSPSLPPSFLPPLFPPGGSSRSICRAI